MWYDAAFMYSSLRFITLIRSVSFDCLSLRSLCRCRCVAAQLPAALSDPRIQTHTHTHMCGCIWLYILFVFVLLMFSTFASLNAFAACCIWLRSTSLPAALPQLSVVSVVCLLHSTHLRCCRRCCCCWQPVCMALSLMFLPLCLSFHSYSFISWRISCVLFRFFPTPVCHFVCLYINALVPVCVCVLRENSLLCSKRQRTLDALSLPLLLSLSSSLSVHA